MNKIVFTIVMSLDGFVSDRKGAIDPLYPSFEALDNSELMQEMIRSTGAVLMGNRTFEMAGDPDWYAGNYEFQLPIFVVTDKAPGKLPKQTDQLTFTFVTDGLESALRQAKTAAGAKQVTAVGGATILQQLLGKGLVDELQIAIMPVLLGRGLRLFDHLEEREIKLEKIRITETGPRTDIWFKVLPQ